MSGYAFASSASPSPDFLRMALELGATCCLRKPFTPDALLTDDPRLYRRAGRWLTAEGQEKAPCPNAARHSRCWTCHPPDHYRQPRSASTQVTARRGMGRSYRPGAQEDLRSARADARRRERRAGLRAIATRASARIPGGPGAGSRRPRRPQAQRRDTREQSRLIEGTEPLALRRIEIADD